MWKNAYENIEVNLRNYFVIGILVTLMMATVYPVNTGNPGPQRKLAFGSIGADVRQLQKELNKNGYNVGAADGVYGFTTSKKVREYQQSNGLDISGTVDPETLERLIKVQPGDGAKGAKESGNIVNRQVKEDRKLNRQLSEKEIMLLARAVNGEARGESFEGQVAVAAVILNRTESPAFPQSVQGVIFQQGAFDAVDDGQIWLEPSRSAVRAAYRAAEGYDNSGGALYYFNPAKSTSKWIWTRPQIKKIGDHIFAR